MLQYSHPLIPLLKRFRVAHKFGAAEQKAFQEQLAKLEAGKLLFEEFELIKNQESLLPLQYREQVVFIVTNLAKQSEKIKPTKGEK